MAKRLFIPALVLAALICAPSAHAIVGGATVSITDHPYQARVVMAAPSGTYSCGGVIYDSTHVVTAAHCAYIDSTLLAPNKVAVGYGSADRRSLTAAPGVSEVTIPSSYLNDGSYDVAVLTLSAPLTFSPSAAPIPVATAGALSTGVAGEDDAFATGWGTTTYRGTSPDLLRGVALPLRADAICATNIHYLGDYQADRSVCAGGKAAGPNAPDTCQGDSGGPLALDSGTGYELVGLTSNGYKCGEPFTPAIYTETSNPEIAAVIAGSASEGSVLRGSAGAPSGGGSGTAPAVTIPPAQAPPPPGVATRDVIRPTARVSRLSCTKKRKCTFRVAAADQGGTVQKLAANVTRKVRRCRTRGNTLFCSTATRKKTLRPKRITGGFTFTATLAKATYKLTAVATDASGNRSKALTKSFRVR